MIGQLIDKQDTFEQVRDQVALILAQESTSQQALATAAGKDPALWKLRVFIERTNPWEFLRTNNGQPPTDRSPVVCVWYDGSNLDGRASQTIDRQQMTATVNIDVYGIGVTELLGGAGHVPGDQNAALEAQRGARLVRNILMSDSYVYLGLRGLVGERSITGVQSYQPDSGAQNAQQMSAMRLTLQVKLVEYGPQTAGVTLDEINAIVRDGDGMVLVDATYQSTP
jgi:hypothetical protein